jgi:suppressor for copper-sensitivity B
MGVGMALPFIALALFPAAAAWLPRPGAWMRWLRVALGAMLFGTVMWLLVVLATVAGTRSSETVALLLAALIGVLVLTAQPQRAAAQYWPKALSVALAAGVIAVTSGRNDQQPLGATHGNASVSASRWPVDGYDWQPFDPKRIETLIGEGKTVFVDVTATWCLTCKVNELTVLSQADVKRAIQAPNVVRMRADWSHVDPLIARYVQSFGRAGIPLDVVYGPARVSGEALPELLNASVLTTALARARGGA